MHRLWVSRISRLAICIVLIALGVTQPSWVEVHAAGEGWYSSWQLRKAITIDATKVSSGPHTNFPVLINLTSDSSLAARAQADGDDILFTSSDGTTKLSHEIEKYTSSTGALVAWVKVPILSSASNTVLYMYYDNAAAADGQSATAVWDANFKGIWHLKEDPSVAGANGIVDSTSNANHGTDNGAMDAADQVAGQIDGSLDFDGTNDFVDMGNVLDNDGSSAMTISLWIKTTGTQDTIVSKQSNTGDQTGYRILVENSGAFSFVMQQIATTNRLIVNGTTAVNDGQWHHLVLTYTGSKTVAGVTRYIDNSVDAVLSSSDLFTGSSSNAISFNISSRNDGADTLFAGIIDEVRVSDSARSAGWITTEFNNQGTPTTFYAVGAATSSPANFFQLFE